MTGNAATSPWRIGGSNINNTERAVYTTTAFASALSKIEIEFGDMTSITVNSLMLVYSTNSDFSNSKDIVKRFNSTIQFSDLSTIEFDTEGGFPANCYYKIVLNVSVPGSSQEYVQLKAVRFYGKAV